MVTTGPGRTSPMRPRTPKSSSTPSSSRAFCSRLAASILRVGAAGGGRSRSRLGRMALSPRSSAACFSAADALARRGAGGGFDDDGARRCGLQPPSRHHRHRRRSRATRRGRGTTAISSSARRRAAQPVEQAEHRLGIGKADAAGPAKRRQAERDQHDGEQQTERHAFQQRRRADGFGPHGCATMPTSRRPRPARQDRAGRHSAGPGRRGPARRSSVPNSARRSSKGLAEHQPQRRNGDDRRDEQHRPAKALQQAHRRHGCRRCP